MPHHPEERSTHLPKTRALSGIVSLSEHLEVSDVRGTDAGVEY
jgi:hypothetical protein